MAASIIIEKTKIGEIESKHVKGIFYSVFDIQTILLIDSDKHVISNAVVMHLNPIDWICPDIMT